MISLVFALIGTSNCLNDCLNSVNLLKAKLKKDSALFVISRLQRSNCYRKTGYERDICEIVFENQVRIINQSLADSAEQICKNYSYLYTCEQCDEKILIETLGRPVFPEVQSRNERPARRRRRKGLNPNATDDEINEAIESMT